MRLEAARGEWTAKARKVLAALDAGLLFHSVVYEQPTKILNKEVTGLKLYLKGTTLEGRSMEN